MTTPVTSSLSISNKGSIKAEGSQNINVFASIDILRLAKRNATEELPKNGHSNSKGLSLVFRLLELQHRVRL